MFTFLELIVDWALREPIVNDVDKVSMISFLLISLRVEQIVFQGKINVEDINYPLQRRSCVDVILHVRIDIVPDTLQVVGFYIGLYTVYLRGISYRV